MDGGGALNIENNALFLNTINIGKGLNTITNIGALLADSFACMTANVSQSLTVGSSGTALKVMKFYTLTKSISGSTTSAFTFPISGFTATPHVIASVGGLPTGTPQCLIFNAIATSTTNINCQVTNPNLSVFSYTIEFMVNQF